MFDVQKGDRVAFKITAPFSNDNGFLYSGIVIKTYINGFRLITDGNEWDVLFEYIKILSVKKSDSSANEIRHETKTSIFTHILPQTDGGCNV